MMRGAELSKRIDAFLRDNFLLVGFFFETLFLEFLERLFWGVALLRDFFFVGM